MRSLLFLLTLCLLCSCYNDKVIHLPEIDSSDINEILDVSPGYLFYDESKPDSVELNRKNLISTTNWLVNVDKRLTLDQAIPKIRFLQDKKRNAKMHKNEAAKNYFTCNDTSIKNLGFIEFTDVVYTTYKDEEGRDTDNNAYLFDIIVKSMDSIILKSYVYPTHANSNMQTNNTIVNTLISQIESLKTIYDPDHSSDNYIIYFSFNRNLTFQDYISIKSLFIDFMIENTTISNNEFIY